MPLPEKEQGESYASDETIKLRADDYWYVIRYGRISKLPQQLKDFVVNN